MCIYVPSFLTIHSIYWFTVGPPKIAFTWFKTTISLRFIVVRTIVRWGYKPTDVPPLAIPRRVKRAFGMAAEARTEASGNE